MMTSSSPLQAADKQSKSMTWVRCLMLVGEIGWIIALPAVGLGILGRSADLKFGYTPWLFILGLLLAFTLSSFIVYRRVKSALAA